MIKMPITTAQPGMTLARPILNESGIVVFGKGIVLTEELLGRIKAMNVFSLAVEGRPAPQRSLEEELTALDERFRRVEGEPRMAEIKKIVKIHIESIYEQ